MRMLIGFGVVLVLLFGAAALYWATVPATIEYVAPQTAPTLPPVLLETPARDEPIELQPTS